MPCGCGTQHLQAQGQLSRAATEDIVVALRMFGCGRSNSLRPGKKSRRPWQPCNRAPSHGSVARDVSLLPMPSSSNLMSICHSSTKQQARFQNCAHVAASSVHTFPQAATSWRFPRGCAKARGGVILANNA
eukprot:366370-Chlamydomonas_euryale.AAC.6